MSLLCKSTAQSPEFAWDFVGVAAAIKDMTASAAAHWCLHGEISGDWYLNRVDVFSTRVGRGCYYCSKLRRNFLRERDMPKNISKVNHSRCNPI
jgi:hypothetical protein